MSKSDTPETDELSHSLSSTAYDPQGDCDALWPHSRDLERRLNAAREALVALNHPSLNAKDRDDIINGALSKIKPSKQ